MTHVKRFVYGADGRGVTDSDCEAAVSFTGSDQEPAASSGQAARRGPKGPSHRDRLLDFEALARRLRSLCTCGHGKRQATPQQHVCRATSFGNDVALFERLKAHRVKFAELHKCDQDHMLFHLVRDLVVPGQTHLAFFMFGMPLCRKSFKTLLGVGDSRVSRLLQAARAKATSPPADLRYLTSEKV